MQEFKTKFKFLKHQYKTQFNGIYKINDNVNSYKNDFVKAKDEAKIIPKNEKINKIYQNFKNNKINQIKNQNGNNSHINLIT